MPGATPSVAKSFLLIAVTAGIALVIAVLLWLTDVITLPVFIGVIAVTGLVEIAAIIVLQRRAARHQARTHEAATREGVSTFDADSPHLRYGYDPLAGRDPVIDQEPGREDDSRS